METTPYPLRIPIEIIHLAKLRAKDEYIDQTTALRQLLHLGAEEYLLTLIQKGRLSVSLGAEILKIPVQDIYRLAEKHGTHLGANPEQQLKSESTLKKLVKK